ncbi:MAG: hypothetical protein FIB04_11480 [Gammaproteobacteria bacterium]|nr:hypothetical protein [Gammaproteobacteria bacterium]
MIIDKRLHCATLIAALFACATAAAATLPAPETVRAQLKTVAVMPARVPADVPNRAQAEMRIEQAVEARLVAAGIAVIPASEMRALQDKVRAALGGYYDPRTGDVDEQRAKAFNEHVDSEFRRLHPADAWLYSRVESRRVPAQGAWASWDGVQESTIGAASFGSKVFRSPAVAGSLQALSLHVGVLTPQGEVLYHRYGALQLLEYYEESSGASAFGFPEHIGYVPVSPDAILTDPAREQRAIALALDPLLLDAAQQDAAKDANKEAWKQIKPAAKGERPAKPADVDRAAFLAKYHRVAVAAIELPDELPNRALVRERYAAALEAGLAKAGFEVVPPAAYAAVWEPIYVASGGFYDPMTGELLEGKRMAALREAFAKLGGESPVDLVFVPSIAAREARIESGNAKWDGATVDLAKGGALFDKSRAFGGTVPAASLELRALDSSIQEVFLGYGGIELLVRFKSGGLMSSGGFEDIPMADWFTDPAHDAEAVERALGSLVAAP